MGQTEKKYPPSQTSLTPFLLPLQAVQNLLQAFGGQGVIIGGIAASLLGAPRFTADVDVVILLELDDLPQLLKEAMAQGLETRILEAEAFARQNRVLLLRHAASGVEVDISLGLLPFETEMVARSQQVQVGNLALRLPTPEDLIILKTVAHRPKDLLDIDAIISSQPNLDKEHIRYWVLQFAEALDMPEFWEDIKNRFK